jgi:hypothetical protein
VHCILDGGPSLHFSALDGGGMHHPHLPNLSSSIEKGAITGVLGSLDLHWDPGEELALQEQKLNHVWARRDGFDLSSLVRVPYRGSRFHPVYIETR